MAKIEFKINGIPFIIFEKGGKMVIRNESGKVCVLFAPEGENGVACHVYPSDGSEAETIILKEDKGENDWEKQLVDAASEAHVVYEITEDGRTLCQCSMGTLVEMIFRTPGLLYEYAKLGHFTPSSNALSEIMAEADGWQKTAPAFSNPQEGYDFHFVSASCSNSACASFTVEEGNFSSDAQEGFAQFLTETYGENFGKVDLSTTVLVEISNPHEVAEQIPNPYDRAWKALMLGFEWSGCSLPLWKERESWWIGSSLKELIESEDYDDFSDEEGGAVGWLTRQALMGRIFLRNGYYIQYTA